MDTELLYTLKIKLQNVGQFFTLAPCSKKSCLGRSFSDGFLVLRGSHQLLVYRVRKVWDLHLLEFTLGKGGHSDSLMALCTDVVTGNTYDK